jgi:hypothetical protein
MGMRRRHCPDRRRTAVFRQLNRPSRRLLRTAYRARLVTHHRYYSVHTGSPMARPPGPPVAGLSEIEAAYYAGFRSIRAFKWAQRHGGFPEPVRRTPQGPVWLVSQIDAWLSGELQPQVITVTTERINEVTDPEEAALLARVEALAVPAPAHAS